MEEVLTPIKKIHWYSNFPKWVKVLLLIVSLITMVYWVGFIIYKILSAIRSIGAFIFDKRNYWVFLTCILILVVGALLIAQFYFDLNPFGQFYEWLLEQKDYTIQWIIDLLA